MVICGVELLTLEVVLGEEEGDMDMKSFINRVISLFVRWEAMRVTTQRLKDSEGESTFLYPYSYCRK